MRSAFSLVELLVVITTMVVLLSLLAPAMDKAIYRAELSLCASQLHAMGTSLTAGATERQRRYPKRFSSAILNVVPMALDHNGMNGRPAIAEYVGGINGLFNCPLSGEVDLEGTTEGELTVASYMLWFDWHWTVNGGRRATKIGDPIEYDGKKYHLLAQDYDLVAEAWSTPSLMNSHPDETQTLFAYRLDETEGDVQTWSAWVRSSSPLPVRGAVDNNVMYQDLSVEMYNAIQNNGVPIGEHDERFDAVPYWRTGGSYPSLRVFVPRS